MKAEDDSVILAYLSIGFRKMRLDESFGISHRSSQAADCSSSILAIVAAAAVSVLVTPTVPWRGGNSQH